MDAKTPTYQRLIVGVGGALLIASLLLPWADVDDVRQTGWEFNSVAALYFLVGGVFGIATAITVPCGELPGFHPQAETLAPRRC